jgi:hypothetical protein
MLLALDRDEISADTTAAISCRIAKTRQEREAAFRLVYRSYLRSGLGERNDYEVRVTPYHLLPTTEVFIAEYQGEVIFTMSLVTDGALGVPMEHVYGDEIARLRRQGLLVGEVSCLADRRSQLARFLPLFLRTSRVMVQYARRRGLDALVAAVHPKHARLYRRYFDFRVMGEQREYPTVRNRPALALWVDFARLDRECPENYRGMLAQPLGEEELRPHPMDLADCAYFRPMVDPSFECGPIGDAENEGRVRSNELAACVA